MPADFFDGIVLEAGLPTRLATGEALNISGSATDLEIEEVSFIFSSEDGDTQRVSGNVVDGAFSRTVLFPHSQSGAYTLDVFAGPTGGILPHRGDFAPISVTLGSGQADLPSDFFEGITLSADVPTDFFTGEAIALSGTASDPEIDRVTFVFNSESGDTFRVNADLIDGAFTRSVVFARAQAGSYALDVWAGSASGGIPHRGEFTGITVSEGSEAALLPTSYFEGISLSAPIPTEIVTGAPVVLSGTTADPGIETVRFRFSSASGDTLMISTDLVEGAFSRVVAFTLSQAGSYTLDVWAGSEDAGIPHRGGFPGITVSAGSDPAFIPGGFFEGLSLGGIPTEIVTGQEVALAGTATDSGIETVTFRFTSESGDTLRVDLDIVESAFSRVVTFARSQAGRYTLDVWAGSESAGKPHRGEFTGITISEGSQPVFLPPGFFDGIKLSDGIPTEIVSGDGVTLAGTVTDPEIGTVRFSFTSESGDTVLVSADVVDGAFRRGTVFRHAQSGTYRVDLHAGPPGGALPHRGSFNPIEVSRGAGPVYLPVDAFEAFTLDQPLLSELIHGKSARLSGVLADATPTQISTALLDENGSWGPSSVASVVGGRFDLEIPFGTLSPGDYEMMLWAGQEGEALPFLDRLRPLTILTSRPRLTAPSVSIDFGIADVGQSVTRTLTIANAGTENLTISQGSVTEPFEVHSLSSSIAPGDSGRVTVLFRPRLDGEVGGRLVLMTNDPSTSSISFDLSGSGRVAPIPILSLGEDELTWPSAAVGDSIINRVVVRNAGKADLEIFSIDTVGPFSVLTPSRTLSPGDSLSVEVVFRPVEAGTHSGSLNFQTNAGQAITTVALVGSASQPDGLAGDIDGSGSVDFADFLSFAVAFGTSIGEAGYVARADIDGNGTVDFGDFLTLATQFGKSP